MSWFRTLRSYYPMARRSVKVQESEAEWTSVYRVVDQRSEGQCEHTAEPTPPLFLPTLRCPRQARQHHHVTKPRRSHHDPDHVVHLCIPHHERCEWPYHRGRLVVEPRGRGAFVFRILFASDKWAARGEPGTQA